MQATRAAYFTEYLKATQEELNQIEKLDPTSGASNGVWLLKGIREGWFKEMDDEVPRQKVRESLLTFQRLKDSPRFKEAGYSSDLNTYSWDGLSKLFDNYWELLSNKQRLRHPKGCELIIDRGPWKVYRAFEPEAAIALGSNSSWCTNNPSTSAEYLGSGNLWIYRLMDEPYAQLHVPTKQFQNKFNRSVMSSFLGGSIIADCELDKMTSEIAKSYSEVREFEKNLFPLPAVSKGLVESLLDKGNPNLIRRALPLFEDRRKEFEKILFTSGQYITTEFHNLLSYFSKIKSDEELENLVASGKDPVVALAYTFSQRRARWEELEKCFDEKRQRDSEYEKLYKKYITKYVGLEKVSLTNCKDICEWMPVLNTWHEGMIETLKTKISPHEVSIPDLASYFIRVNRRCPEIEERLRPGTSSYLNFYTSICSHFDVNPLPEALIDTITANIEHWGESRVKECVDVFFKKDGHAFFERIVASKASKDLDTLSLLRIYLAINGVEEECPWFNEKMLEVSVDKLSDLSPYFIDYVAKHPVDPRILERFYISLERHQPYSLRNYFFQKGLQNHFPGFMEILKGAPLDGFWIQQMNYAIRRWEIHQDYVDVVNEKKLQSDDPHVLVDWALSSEKRLPEAKEALVLDRWLGPKSLDYFEKLIPFGIRNPKIEEFLLLRGNVDLIVRYTRKVGRIPAIEERILKEATPKEIETYAIKALKGYFPEGLPRLNSVYRKNLHQTRIKVMEKIKAEAPGIQIPEGWNQFSDGLILQKFGREVSFRNYLYPEMVATSLEEVMETPKWISWREEWTKLSEEEKAKAWFPRVKKESKEKK